MGYDDLPDPWIAPPLRPDALVKELASEIGCGHALYGRRMLAIAQRADRDEVLFRSNDGEPEILAVVHLTWSGHREEDPQWPSTKMLASFEELL